MSIFTRTDSQGVYVAREKQYYHLPERAASALMAIALLGTGAAIVAVMILTLGVGMDFFGLRPFLANPWGVAFSVGVVILLLLAGLDAAVNAVARRPLVMFNDRIVLPRKRRIGTRFVDDVVPRQDVVEVRTEALRSRTMCTIVTRDGRHIRFLLERFDNPSDAIDQLRGWPRQHRG